MRLDSGRIDMSNIMDLFLLSNLFDYEETYEEEDYDSLEYEEGEEF